MSEKATGPGKQSYTVALGVRSGRRLPRSALKYYRGDGTKSHAPTEKPLAQPSLRRKDLYFSDYLHSPGAGRCN